MPNGRIDVTGKKIPREIRLEGDIAKAFPELADPTLTEPTLGAEISGAIKVGLSGPLFDGKLTGLLTNDSPVFAKLFQEEELGTVNWTDALNTGLISAGIYSSLMEAINGAFLTIAGAIELLRLNGVDFPGRHFTSPEEVPVLEGRFVVKAAVTTKKKADKGLVKMSDGEGLRSTVSGVLDAMRENGLDPAQGVIVQPLIDPGVEMLVSVKNTPYGTETTVKLGGKLAEEHTTTIRFLGDVNEAELVSGLSAMPGVSGHSIGALVEVIKGLQQTAAKNIFLDLIETNPVIASLKDNSAVPVDVRLFGREIPPSITDIMPQGEFNEQMQRALDPKIVLVLAPAENVTHGERYLMTLNALASRQEGREVVFVHPKRPNMEVQLLTGGTEQISTYPTVEDVLANVGMPDLIIAPLRPEGTIELAELSSKWQIPLIMMGAGFGETGSEEGLSLKQRLLEVLEQGRFVGFGPNTVGVISRNNGLEATFLLPKKYGKLEGEGKIALATQSGAVLEEIRNFLQFMGVPISHGVAIGNGYGLRLHQLAMFNQTVPLNAEFYYIETDPGQAFIEALKKKTKDRPVVILKGGRFSGNAAARSHTDSISGSSAAFEMAARNAGAIVVERTEVVPLLLKLLDGGMAKRLAEKMVKAREEGQSEPGIEFVNQSGADGVMISDILGLSFDMGFAKPGDASVEAFGKILEGFLRINPNPVDVGPKGDIAKVLTSLVGDPRVGGTVVLLNTFWFDYMIPKTPLPDVIFNLTNDPDGKITQLAISRGWPVARDKMVALEALNAVYEYARFLSETD